MPETRELTYTKDGEEMGKLLSNFVNNMSVEREVETLLAEVNKLVAEAKYDHRTLQQAWFGLALAIIFTLSTNNTDLRNEYAVRDAKKVVELLGIKDLRDIAFMVA